MLKEISQRIEDSNLAVEKMVGLERIPLGLGKAVLYKEKKQGPFCLAVNGGLILEKFYGKFLQRSLDLADRFGKKDLMEAVFGSGSTGFWKPGDLCWQLAKHTDFAPASINVSRYLLDRDQFSLTVYAQIVDQALDCLYQREANDIEGEEHLLIGESIGGAAVLQAVVERMAAGKPIPREMILINPLINGFATPVRGILESLGELDPRKTSGLAIFRRNSEQLINLRQSITDCSQSKLFPQTTVVCGHFRKSDDGVANHILTEMIPGAQIIDFKAHHQTSRQVFFKHHFQPLHEAN